MTFLATTQVYSMVGLRAIQKGNTAIKGIKRNIENGRSSELNYLTYPKQCILWYITIIIANHNDLLYFN